MMLPFRFPLEFLLQPLCLGFGGPKQAAPAPAAPTPPPAPPTPARATAESRTVLSQILPKRGMRATILTRDPFTRYGGAPSTPGQGNGGGVTSAVKTLLGSPLY